MAPEDQNTTLPIVRTVEDLSTIVADWRSGDARVGFVPTMGALHEGHLSLVDHAAGSADKVVVSIFVNPAQFAPGEDLDAYPRTEKTDAAALATRPADLIYAPNAREMYPDGYDLGVEVGGPSQGLETDFRPHFFRGVATVVTKLFLQVKPDIAVFGEKDYQQLLVVRKLTRDLGLPIEILAGATHREWDGLALSSRNAYLSEEERARAAQLYAALNDVAHRLADGEPIDKARDAGWQVLKGAGFKPIDYLEVRDADTLAPLTSLEGEVRILGAARMGTTRLIDNIALGI